MQRSGGRERRLRIVEGYPFRILSSFLDQSYSGLDSAEWVPRGYAVINVDACGAGESEGNIRWWGSGEGRDGHDAIEELAKLPWGNDKIGMARRVGGKIDVLHRRGKVFESA